MSAHTVGCKCGEWSGEACAWEGPSAQTMLVEFMPEQHRESHAAGRNAGTYPHNGAIRIRVNGACAKHMLRHDRAWVRVLGGGKKKK